MIKTKTDLAFSLIRNSLIIYIIVGTDIGLFFAVLYFVSQFLMDYFDYKGVDFRDFKQIKNYVIGTLGGKF